MNFSRSRQPTHIKPKKESINDFFFFSRSQKNPAPGQFHVNVHDPTIRKTLDKNAINERTARCKPLLTKTITKAHIQKKKKKSQISQDLLDNISWTDESEFFGKDGSCYILSPDVWQRCIYLFIYEYLFIMFLK